ncbi:hypothetical protein B0H65DRAFT_420632 [Neurospora tetraspora]|uniref:Uncharacterized protein n=1 Tax=Neurospora tetraspora TaxID=94610 RepID=A0AAE0MUF6_9PEZI|nr:hypothetical protein B0H65DRAFT_420632 [Neurospora tetraspora]
MTARSIIDPSPPWTSTLLPPARSRSRSSSQASKPKPTGKRPKNGSQLQIQPGARANPQSTTSLASNGSMITTTTATYSGGTTLRRTYGGGTTLPGYRSGSGSRRRSSNLSKEWRHDPKRNKKAQEAARKIMEGCYSRKKRGRGWRMKDRVRKWGRELRNMNGLRGLRDDGGGAGRRGGEAEGKREGRWSWRRGRKGVQDADNGVWGFEGHKRTDKPAAAAAAAAAAAEETRWQLALGPWDETTGIPLPPPIPKPPRNSVAMDRLAEVLGASSTEKQKDTNNRRYADYADRGEVHEHKKMQSKHKNRTSGLWKRGLEKVKKLLISSTDIRKAHSEKTTTTMDRNNKANESDEESSHKSSQKPSPRRPPILRLKSMVAPPTYWYIDEKDNESHFGEGKLPRSAKEKGKGIDYRLYHEDSIFKTHRPGFPPPREGPKAPCECKRCKTAIDLVSMATAGNQGDGTLLPTYQGLVPSYRTANFTRSPRSIPSSSQTPPAGLPSLLMPSRPTYLGSRLPPYQDTWALPPISPLMDFGQATEFSAFTFTDTGRLPGTFQESASLKTTTSEQTPTKTQMKTSPKRTRQERTTRPQGLLKNPSKDRRIPESEEDHRLTASPSKHITADITSDGLDSDPDHDHSHQLDTQENEHKHEQYEDETHHPCDRAPSYVGTGQRPPKLFFTRPRPPHASSSASASVSAALPSPVPEEGGSNSNSNNTADVDHHQHEHDPQQIHDDQLEEKHRHSHHNRYKTGVETGVESGSGPLRHTRTRTASVQVDSDLLIIPLEEVEDCYYLLPHSCASSSSDAASDPEGDPEGNEHDKKEALDSEKNKDEDEDEDEGEGEDGGEQWEWDYGRGGWRIVDGGNGRVNERGGGGVNIKVREMKGGEGKETETGTGTGTDMGESFATSTGTGLWMNGF